MKAALKGVLLGLVAYLVSLILIAPARLATDYLPTNIRVSGVSGTVLRGYARDVQINTFDLGSVAWKLKPISLLLGQVRANLILDHPDLQGRSDVVFQPGGGGIENATLSANAGVLGPYLSGYGVNVTGQLDLDAVSFVASKDGPEAVEGRLVWRNAELNGLARLSLGDVQLKLTQQGESAMGELSNDGQSISVNGNVELNPGWKYQARIRIEPTPTTPNEIQQALKLLGTPDSKGAVTINHNGDLALFIGATR